MKKKLIIVMVTAMAIAAGYVGLIKYEQHKFIKSIIPHVKNASIRLANVVEFETGETKITFKELFEKLESDIAEIDKRIIDVQTIATPSNKEVTDSVLAYLKGSQELLRSLLLKYRKTLDLRSARDWADRSIDDLRNVGQYGYEYASKAADRAIKDLEKAEKEYSKAKLDVLNATNNLKKAHAKLAASIPSDALADPAIFEADAKKNKTKKSDSTPLQVVTIEPNEPIHIAYWLVTAGPDSTLGIDSKRGVEIAIDDINNNLLGHKIKFDGQNSGCNAEGGEAAATELASDPTIIAAIGSNCSSEAKIGAPILWNAGIPTVSPSNTAPYLTDPKRGSTYDGYLRTSHNDKIQGAVAANFAFKSLKVKRAATIHDGSVYAEQLANVFAETFKKNGGTIVAQEAVAPTDTDMKQVLTMIATAKPEFIYYPIFVAAAGHITRQAKEVSGLEKVAMMSADGAFSVDFYKAAGKSAVGMYHSSPDFEAFGKVYEDFIQKHIKKYSEKTLAPFHGHAYDAANMIFKAIEKVAKKEKDGILYIDRKALRDALYATKNMKGITGNITCNEFGDCADPRIAVYKTSAENVKSLVMPRKSFWKPY